MGTILSKTDFYSQRDPHPALVYLQQFPPIFNHMETSKKIINNSNEKNKAPEPPTKLYHDLNYKSTYDDYSETSQPFVLKSVQSQQYEIKPQKQQVAEKQINQTNQETPLKLENAVTEDSKIQTKIILLPASQKGPVLLNFEKHVGSNIKDQTLEQVKSKYLSSKKSSVKSSAIQNSPISGALHIKITPDQNQAQLPLQSPQKQSCQKYIEMSRQAWMSENYQKCIAYLIKGLDVCQVQHPHNHHEKGLYHKRLGANYWKIYNIQLALQHFREALRCFQMELYPQVREISSVLHNIGGIYQEQNKLSQALEYYSKSLQLKRQFLPQIHSQIAEALSSIGLLQWTVGQYGKSVDSFGEALHINKQIYGYNHPQVAKTYYNLSMCLFNVEEFDLWLDYHYESLRIMKKIGLNKSGEYQHWIDSLKLRIKQLLTFQRHQENLIIKSLDMITHVLDKDEQIQYLTQIKDYLQKK